MGKSWEQFKHLDEAEYAQEIAPLSPEELTAEHGRITRKLIAASVGTGFGVIGLPASGGFSIIPTGIQGRRINVNRRRLKIIEARLAEIGAPKYHPHKRDFAIPTAVNLVSMGMSTGAESLVGTEGFLVGGHFVAENAAGAAAQHGAEMVYLTSGQHLVSVDVVNAVSTAGEMVQEPLYTKIGEEINEKITASKSSAKEAWHHVVSVPSTQLATVYTKVGEKTNERFSTSKPTKVAVHHVIPSVPSSHFAQASSLPILSVPSPQFSQMEQSQPIYAVPSVPSPRLAPVVSFIPPSKLGAPLSPQLAPTEKVPVLPPRPASALSYREACGLLVPSLELSSDDPPPPHTPSMPPGTGPFKHLPASGPVSKVGLPSVTVSEPALATRIAA